MRFPPTQKYLFLGTDANPQANKRGPVPVRHFLGLWGCTSLGRWGQLCQRREQLWRCWAQIWGCWGHVGGLGVGFEGARLRFEGAEGGFRGAGDSFGLLGIRRERFFLPACPHWMGPPSPPQLLPLSGGSSPVCLHPTKQVQQGASRKAESSCFPPQDPATCCGDAGSAFPAFLRLPGEPGAGLRGLCQCVVPALARWLRLGWQRPHVQLAPGADGDRHVGAVWSR